MFNCKVLSDEKLKYLKIIEICWNDSGAPLAASLWTNTNCMHEAHATNGTSEKSVDYIVYALI